MVGGAVDAHEPGGGGPCGLTSVCREIGVGEIPARSAAVGASGGAECRGGRIGRTAGRARRAAARLAQHTRCRCDRTVACCARGIEGRRVSEIAALSRYRRCATAAQRRAHGVSDYTRIVPPAVLQRPPRVCGWEVASTSAGAVMTLPEQTPQCRYIPERTPFFLDRI